MIKLPNMKYSDGIKKATQVKFKGYNHNLGAGDGEIYDMTNLSGLYYPLLSTRPKRRLLTTLTAPHGLFGRDKLAYVDGTNFYYDGAVKGTVAASDKVFAAIGDRIIIFPDKKYYDTEEDEFGDLGATWSGAVTFQDGYLYEEAAEANTIYAAGVTWSDYFSKGDAVTISGCVTYTDNNKTPIIREIDDTAHTMSFYENIFDNGSESAVTIARTVPDMDFIFENENRLWGCKGDTMYASKLGDPFNWNVFDGISTDAWSWDAGSAGDFNGAKGFLGYPCFFKEDHIYKNYGSIPSNYQPMSSADLGVADGSGKSLAIAKETLFYLSRAGMMAYAGGIPTPIGDAFGNVRYKNAVAGSDGTRYYVSMQDDADAWHLFVYDTGNGQWFREDSTHVLDFAFCDGNLYFLNSSGQIWITGNIIDPPTSTEEDPVSWIAEFGDFVNGDPNKKGVSKIQLRAELETGATMTAYIKFDSETAWTAVKTLAAASKRSYYLPIIPRRGDHYRLKLTGTGGCRIYSMSLEYYSGSEL
ncbi:MAG: hypothetical protein EOM03_05975 [Clostridia bacterium]|nr:hypothetical protein [Clostridia bacterium]